jgi:hypothetical protein
LRTLAQASEAVSALRARVTALETKATELALESASLLDVDGQEEQESALVTTQRVVEAKLSRARERLSQAEGGLEARTQAVRGEFGRLHLIYRLWRVEGEKKKLLAHMVDGCPVLSIDQVTLHLKSIAGLRELEITASDALGLVRQCERLLEAVAGESGFELPPVSAAPASSVAVAAPAQDWSGPWDPLDGTIDVQKEIRDLLQAGYTLQNYHEELRRRHPGLYKTREQVSAIASTSLPQLATGIYEQEKGGKYRLYVPAVGSTSTID